LTVYTEAANGVYSFTPVIAAMAGAKRYTPSRRIALGLRGAGARDTLAWPTTAAWPARYI